MTATALRTGPKKFAERVPAEPFVQWINAELAKLEADDTLRPAESNQVPSNVLLAARLNVNERTVYRWRNSLDNSVPPQVVDNLPRMSVEDALHAADVPFADLYSEIAAAEDVDLEPDAYCRACHEIVTPIGGECPWCDGPVDATLPRRMYCKREDCLSFPALDGNCWRCGGRLTPHVPKAPCACDCGTLIARFSIDTGAEIRYVRGHNPRITKDRMAPAGPLVEWVRSELMNLDRIEALAFLLGVRRGTLVGLLRGDIDQVRKIDAARMLHYAAYDGRPNGHARVRRRTVPSVVELFGFANSRVCPACGKSKHPQAKQCQKCRQEKGDYQQASWISATLLEEARRLREDEGLPFVVIGARLQSRTRYRNAEALAHRLRTEFRKRDWSTADLRQSKAAA